MRQLACLKKTQLDDCINEIRCLLPKNFIKNFWNSVKLNMTNKLTPISLSRIFTLLIIAIETPKTSKTSAVSVVKSPNIFALAISALGWFTNKNSKQIINFFIESIYKHWNLQFKRSWKNQLKVWLSILYHKEICTEHYNLCLQYEDHFNSAKIIDLN